MKEQGSKPERTLRIFSCLLCLVGLVAESSAFFFSLEGERLKKISFIEDFQSYSAGGARLDQQSTDWVFGTGWRWLVLDLNGQVAARSQAGSTNITYVTGKTFWPDDTAILDMRFEYTQSGPGAWIGCVFNYEDETNYHVFRMSPDNGRAQLCKVMSGTAVVVFDEPFIAGPGNGTMSLISDPVSRRFTILVNGASNEFFKEVENMPIIAGAVGIYSGDCANFFVRSFEAYADRVPAEILTDRLFQRGLRVLSPIERIIEGDFQRVADNGSPRFSLGQHHSQESVYGVVPTILPSGAWQWSNDFKRVTLGPAGTFDGDLSLYVNSIAEFNDEWREPANPWPHLLIGQRLSPGVPETRVTGQHIPWLSEIKTLDFRIDALLKEAYSSRKDGYLRSRHAAQFLIFFTVQNLSGGPGHGDFYWFGMRLYSDREEIPAPSFLVDGGDYGTGKYIYNIGIPFTATGMTLGEWKSMSGDLLPHIIAGFNAVRAAGGLPESADLADYKLGGMNMGWEVTGLSRVEIQVKNLSLRYVKK